MLYNLPTIFVIALSSSAFSPHPYHTETNLELRQYSKERPPMSITADIIRGHTETIILVSLMEHDSYGYQINKDILRKTGNRYELKEATLYTAFRRLEQAGYITAYWGDEKVGARRRYYSITQTGRKACEQGIREWNEAKNMIDRLLEPASNSQRPT